MRSSIASSSDSGNADGVSGQSRFPAWCRFAGFVGLHPADSTLGYPSVEVGWRLAAAFWGRGYAPEGALAALRFGFEQLHLKEILSFTSVGNGKSRRVMTRIGMAHSAEDDFDHPRLPQCLRSYATFSLGSVLPNLRRDSDRVRLTRRHAAPNMTARSSTRA